MFLLLQLSLLLQHIACVQVLNQSPQTACEQFQSYTQKIVETDEVSRKLWQLLIAYDS